MAKLQQSVTAAATNQLQWFVLFQPILNSNAVKPPTLNEAFVDDMKSTSIPFSHDAEDRVFRSHGKACWEKKNPQCCNLLMLLTAWTLNVMICHFTHNSCIFFQGIAYMRSLLCEKGKLVVFQTWWYGQVSSEAVSSLCFYWSVFLLPRSSADFPLWRRWFKGLISAEAGILICMSGSLIRSVRGRTVDTQYSAVWPVHNTPMNYDSEIGFLLLWLALFYHANECWLMAETWLAASQMGSKSPSSCKHSFVHTST